MAIIYSYPQFAPKPEDLLIGTVTLDENAVVPIYDNPTVSFTIQSLLDMIAPITGAQNLQQVTNIGATTSNTVTFTSDIKVTGRFYDSSGSPGLAGQVLSSTVTGTSWIVNSPASVTSVGLAMPAAFTVANTPITTAGVLTVTGAGTAAQYINGLGNLVTFPTIPTQYVLPLAANGTRGGIQIGYTSAGKNYAVQLSSEKAFVNVPWTDTPYVLPVATNAALGGIKIGYTDNAKNYAVELDTDSEAFVNVPWTDTPYTLPVATSSDLGGVKIGYTEAGKNYPVELDSQQMYVNVPWTDTPYVLPLAANGTRGGVQIGYTEAGKNYPVELDTEKMFVNVPWTDTQNPFQTITGTGSGNTNSGIILSNSGGTVLILGDGSVTAAQTGNTITLTGVNTWVANAVTVAGYVAAPAATDANLVWKTNASGEPAWRVDATIPDTGITGVTLAINSTGTWTVPLSESITGRELTLTSNVYGGGAKVGYVPTGGTTSTYLKGDGTWAAIPTGLQFKGTWDASGGGGGSPDLTQSGNKGAGFLWICDDAGTAYPNGGSAAPSTWALGDWCIYDGTAWTRVPATNAGVTSVTTTDGTYIDLTPDAESTGPITVTADLSAQDGSSDTNTKFLSKDNTWDVPSYTTNTDETYDLNAGAKVGTSVPINLTSTSGADNSLVNLKEGTNITLTRGSATEITIDATDTNTNTTYDFLAIETIPTFTLNTSTTNTGYTTAVNLATTVSPAGGTGMTVDITASSGNVTAVVINKPGSGYAVGDAVTVVQTGSSANAIITLSGSVGNVNPNLRLIDNAFGFDDVKLTGAGATTITRTSDIGITITSTDTNTTYTAGNGLNLSGTVFSADVNNTQANSATTALSNTAGRFYAVQLDNNAAIANADLVVNVPWVDTIYSAMTTSTLGLGKIRYDVGSTPAAESQSTTASRTYGVTKNASNQLVVNVPWVSGGTYSWKVKDNVTPTIETLASGDTLQFVMASHNAAPTATLTDTSGSSPYIMTLTGKDTTYSNFTAATASAAGVSGLVVAPPVGAQGKFLRGDATWVSETTYSNFTGADGTSAGTAGLVPAPAATDNVKFLKGDGTWASTPQGDITEIKTTAPITGAAASGIATIAISNMGAATASAAGTKGAVPASAAGDQLKFLRADATWVIPDDDDTLYALAGAASSTTGEYDLVLSAAGTAQDTMVFKEGSNVTFTRAANSLTIAAANDNDNTTYSIDVPSSTTNINLKGANPTTNDAIALTPGTYVSIVRNSDSQLTFDLSAADGFDGFGTRYLSKDNTWDVPRTTNIEIIVTVVSGKFVLNGTSQADYTLMSGFTYQFNQEDTSNNGHPFAFSTNANNSPAAPYTTGVATSNTPGTTGSYTQIQVGPSTPNLYYYCTVHSGMGGSAPREASFISLTTTGTSGASTLTNGILNVPEYEDTQENTKWYVRDSGDDDKLVNNLKYLKFVTATGSLATDLTGAGTTSDPYLMTLTSPDTDNQNTYTAGAGLSVSNFVFSADIDITAANAATQALAGSPPSGRFYAVQLDNNSTVADRKMVVNVPWTDSGDTGITGVTLATGTSTGAPLTESIASRELTLTSMVYAGVANIGYVPPGGSATTFLRGDATWVVPTNTTYSDGNGITFTGNPATTINADINYISYSSNNNFIVYGTQNSQGTTIPTGSQIVYADPSGTQIVNRGLISDLPFSNNSGTVTGTGTSGVVAKWNTAGAGLIDSGLSFPPSTTYAKFVLGSSGGTTVQFIGNASQTGDFSIKNTTGAIILQPNNISVTGRVASFSTTDIRLNESTIVSGTYLQTVDNTATPLGNLYVGSKITTGDTLNGFRINSVSGGLYFDVRNTGDQIIYRDYDGASVNDRFKMDMSAGTFTASGNLIAFGSPSDKRLKENIKPIDSALDKVIKLQGVTFDWKKSDSILDIKQDVGFIAQDVQKVIPELVRENEDGMLSMRHQGIAPILLEAIKELKAEIEELKYKSCNCNK